MNEENLKIGMYTENEIFDYMTEQEGGMLGRSMYDAIFDKIHKLITENKQLKEQRNRFIEWLEKVAYQDVEPSDFANGCKVAYGYALQKYKKIIGCDK